ncbi:AsmA family protein [Jannaschia sp. M317]|uniref:AsmA family protein n=1 Tax=Jannaschia sp. M317 TaxID=2867011 RepID=UPI0021A95168|nr:AsmA family protein [Jannaschia sp. M317]UWQ18905.1 AsmA family protein [Jannaschia sp. M317]
MRWLIRISLTLVALVLVAVVALLLVPTERIAQLAADRFEASTGRALTIDGGLRATLWPRLGVHAEGVEIANAAWSDAGPLLRADSLEIGVTAAALLGGALEVETLEARGARILLERRADGTGNWEFGTAQGAARGPGGAGAAPALTVARAVLTGAEVTYVDRAEGTRWELRALDVSTSIADLSQPVEVTASALLGGVALNADVTVENLLALSEGELTGLTGTLSSGATTVSLDGRADLDPLSFEGRIDAQSTDRFALLAALDIPQPDLPAGLGAERIALASGLTLAPAGSLHLRGMELSLDGNVLTGAMDVAPGADRPRITATLAAPALDLTGLSRKGQGGETALVAETGWGREVIDVSGLFAADAQVSFTSGPITLGDARLDQAGIGIVLDQGRAVVTLRPVVAYGGTVTGDIVINGRGGLSSRATLDLSGLQMQPFLTEFVDFDRLVGQADLSVNLLGVGNTTQALMDSLDGDLSFRLGRGEILGLDVGGMIRNLDANFRGEGQKTIFDGLSGRFAVTDGVARGDDLSLQAPLLAATGAGQVDLGARTLDYRLLPTLRRDAESDGISVPILITGPWSDPRIRPDLEYLAKQRLEIERAELEARARAEADAARARAEEATRQKLAEELEVAPEVLTDRGAVEDAIKERVEEQLLDLLLNR